jgi:beta-N-acetylhexosaminidase
MFRAVRVVMSARGVRRSVVTLAWLAAVAGCSARPADSSQPPFSPSTSFASPTPATASSAVTTVLAPATGLSTTMPVASAATVSTSLAASPPSMVAVAPTVAIATTPVAIATTPVAPTVTIATTPISPTVTIATTLDQSACIEALPLPFRAAQVVMAAVYGDALAASTARVAGMNIGGVILMTWPAGADPAQLAALKATASPPIMVAVDEEGGTVQRLKSLGVLPSPSKVANSMSPAEAEAMIAAHAKAVRALGIDIVLAPVVDVNPLVGKGPIGSRSFGSDPAIVARYAAAYLDGWESAGILPVLKHFPGHGSASGDSHTGRVTTPPLDQLIARDLVPYTMLAGRHPGVMVGHLEVPGLTDIDQKPASLSPSAITGLLRGQLGYADALVFTDALGMDAISTRWSVPDAAVLSLIAGADVVLFASLSDTAPVIAAIEAAVGSGALASSRLDQAVGHVLAQKRVDPCTLRP